MNRSKNLIVLALSASWLFATAAAQAGGGADTGGGSIEEVREARIRTLVAGLREDLLDYISVLKSLDGVGSDVARLQKEALDLGLVQDIRYSKYEFRNDCRDSKDASKAASAVIGKKSGVICFNLPKLVASNATERDIYSLAVHEHLHQLGVADEKRATAIGEAFGPRVAAHLYYFPRADRESSWLPTRAKQDDCLNLRTLFDRWNNLSDEVPAWIGTYDLRIEGEISPAFQKYFPDFAIRLFYQPAEMLRGDARRAPLPFQDGCSKILMPTNRGNYQAMPIVSHTMTSFTVEVRDPVSSLRSMTFSVPEGADGKTLMFESVDNLRLELKCGEAPMTKSSTEEHLVRSRIMLTVGQALPELTPITPGLSQLFAAASEGSTTPDAGCSLIRK
jgi:hypothetical protein